MRKHINKIQATLKMSAIKLYIGIVAWLAPWRLKAAMPCIAYPVPLSTSPNRGPSLIAMAEPPEPPTKSIAAAKSLIRTVLHNRFALGAMALVVVIAAVYLVWGGMGLSALGGGLFGLGLPLVLGESRPWTDGDQLDYDRRWKWDGSSNDDGLSN